jgi:hypothetical protein
MARKQNYGFDKRRKEQDRKAKKDAKAEEKRQRREEQAQAPVDPAPQGSAAEPASPGQPLNNES